MKTRHKSAGTGTSSICNAEISSVSQILKQSPLPNMSTLPFSFPPENPPKSPKWGPKLISRNSLDQGLLWKSYRKPEFPGPSPFGLWGPHFQRWGEMKLICWAALSNSLCEMKCIVIGCVEMHIIARAASQRDSPVHHAETGQCIKSRRPKRGFMIVVATLWPPKIERCSRQCYSGCDCVDCLQVRTEWHWQACNTMKLWNFTLSISLKVLVYTGIGPLSALVCGDPSSSLRPCV